jgi:hypothetical protein
MTVTNQLRVEHRRAPSAPWCGRRRMRRAHDPSCLRGRGSRLRRHPQQQCGDAGGLRGQCKFAAGDEIELAGLPPDFQHDGAERIAGQRVGGGPQRDVGIGCAHRHEQPRVETELAKPAQRQRTRFNFRKILPHPDQRPARRHPSREASDEARGRRALVALGEHFMHRCDCKTAAQRRIRDRMAERDLVEIRRIAMRLEPFDASSQIRKRACACGAHAPLLEKISPLPLFPGEPAAGPFVHDMF